MSKTELKISPSIAQVKKTYARKRKHLLNLDPAMKKVAIFLDQWVQNNFKTEGGNVGGWAPIKRNGMILQDTGVLRHSFVPFTGRKNAGVGSDLDYAKKHNDGKGVIKRRILPRKSDVMKKAKEILKNHVRLSGKIK